MRTKVLLVFSLLAAIAPAHAQPPAAAGLTVEALLRRALSEHPEVRRAKAEVESLEAVARAAGRRIHHNPELGVEAGATTSGGALDLEVGLSQPVELGGQRAARRARANAELARARAKLREAELDVTAGVLEAYGEALAATELLKVSEEAAALSSRLLEAKRVRREEGDATELELNIQRLDAGSARSSVLAARRRLHEANRALSIACGQRLVAGDGLQQDWVILFAALPEVPAGLDPSKLLERLSKRPDLAAAGAEREVAEAELSMAAREAVPTPSVGVLYKRAGDEQVVAGSLALALPVFDRAQAARAEAHGALARTRVEYEALLQVARAQAEWVLLRHASAQEEVELYEGGLNEVAARTAALADEAYRSGKLGLIDALLLRREALATRAAFIEARLELLRAQVAVARALGP